MGKERIALRTDGDLHDEPFVTSEDYLRQRQDKSKMPWTEKHDREQKHKTQRKTETDTSSDSDTRDTRSQPSRSHSRTRTRRQKTQSSDPDSDKVEQQAVQKLVRQLKDRGMSDEFIEENMDKIRERVRNELP